MKKILSVLFIAFFITFAPGTVQAEECFKIVNVTESEAGEESTPPELTVDGSFATSWTANGVVDVWIMWELERVETVPGISIAFLKGDERQAKFDIQVSEDGKSFTNAITGGLSAGDTLDYELFAFPAPVKAKYIKFIGFGNTVNFWNNISEVKFLKELSKESATVTSGGGVQIVSKLDYVCDNAMIFQCGNAAALFGGEKFDVNAPVMDNGSTLIPLRAVVEKLSGKLLWDESTQTAACAVGNTVLKFSVGSYDAEVNGKNVKMNVAARIVDGTFMVPLREFADKMGKSVIWYGSYNIAAISDSVLPELSKWELAELDDRLKR